MTKKAPSAWRRSAGSTTLLDSVGDSTGMVGGSGTIGMELEGSSEMMAMPIQEPIRLPDEQQDR